MGRAAHLMPTLNLTRRECSLLDQALDAYIGTDEHEDVQALTSVREKLAELWRARRWDVQDAAPLNHEQSD